MPAALVLAGQADTRSPVLQVQMSGTGGADEGQWKPSNLKPGAKLNQPGPLFKKLEESVIEEERARLGT